MTKKKQPPQLSRVNYIKTKARALPLYKCYINSYWNDAGLATVLVVRQHTNGNFAFGIYFVDVFNKGLMKSTAQFHQTKIALDDLIEHIVSKDSKSFIIVEIDYALAHNIIYGGHDLTIKNGYKTDKEFETSKYILEENDGTIEYIEINFGKNEYREKIVKENNGEDVYIKDIF